MLPCADGQVRAAARSPPTRCRPPPARRSTPRYGRMTMEAAPGTALEMAPLEHAPHRSNKLEGLAPGSTDAALVLRANGPKISHRRSLITVQAQWRRRLSPLVVAVTSRVSRGARFLRCGDGAFGAISACIPSMRNASAMRAAVRARQHHRCPARRIGSQRRKDFGHRRSQSTH